MLLDDVSDQAASSSAMYFFDCSSPARSRIWGRARMSKAMDRRMKGRSGGSVVQLEDSDTPRAVNRADGEAYDNGYRICGLRLDANGNSVRTSMSFLTYLSHASSFDVPLTSVHASLHQT